MKDEKKKSVEFRFYAELNDFLSIEHQAVDFIYYFNGSPSIKDAIEALGVPHPEVDLILVNNKAVDFNYLLKNGDRIAVYPVFEALDITYASPLRKNPLREPKFILDVHLGKLAKYLRLCGFDTIYNNHQDDLEIIDTAVLEKRIILTRDIGLLKNRKVTHGYWMRATDPKKQIVEILKKFDLFSKMKPFTRCLECNLKTQPIAKEQILDRLAPRTQSYYTEFHICTQCNRLYWRGSHYEKMQKLIEHLQSQRN